jgi:membrane-associated phospholipid phosphatase
VALTAAYRRGILLPTILLVPGSGLLAWGVVRAVWAIVERERPEEVLGSPTAHSWAYVSSYPSGHVAVTVALVAATAWLFPRLRWPLWTYAAVLTVSRILFGAHFPTDLVVAVGVGYAAFLLTRELLLAGGLRIGGVPEAELRLALPLHADLRAAAARAAILAAAASVTAFVVLAETVGFPQGPDGSLVPRALQADAQQALLAVSALGLLLGMLRRGLGGALLVAAALPFGVLAAFEYTSLVALAAFLALFVPGTILLLSAVRTRAGLVAVASALVLLVATGGVAANWVHTYLTGPTHPQSTVGVPPADDVRWAWAGAVTPNGFVVKARLSDEADAVSLRVVRGGSEIRYVPGVFADEELAEFTVSGLRPDTVYRYAVEVDGELDRRRTGRVRTFPEVPSSFRFAFSSCARVGSNGAVFDALTRDDPLFFLAVGDLFYGNVDENDPGAFRAFYDRLLSQPAPGRFFRSTPVAYVWDDHDFGGDGASSASASAPAAESVYRERTPHYPLPGEESGAVYQAFDVGRVRFLVTDTRSQRSPQSEPDGPGKTMLGREQKEWLERELLRGRDRYALLVWVNPDPWIDAPAAGADTWGGYATERRELSSFVAANEIHNLVMLSGDAHMLAADDGSHSDYSGTGGGSFPVLHAAALDRRGGVKGGPYSEGTFPGSGQYGLVTIRDAGETLSVSYSGRDYLGREVVGYRFTITAPAPHR